MLKSGFWKLAAPCLLIIAATLATPSIAGDDVADVVLGQPDFLHNLPNFPDQYALYYPFAVTIDASTTPNRLYVADDSNSRVLGWNDVTTFANGAPADLVIGQPDFYSNACNTGGVSGSSLCYPYGITVDASGNLYVADYVNSRVLEYNTPFAGCGSFPCVGASANMVFGQDGIFTSNAANNGGVSANSLAYPFGVAVDGNGNLYIADASNNRVLEYNTPLKTGTTAHLVFGQGGIFTSNTANNGGVSANSLNEPFGVAVDSIGNLYVADDGNSRLLEYNTPLKTGTSANLVLGQPDFISSTCNNGGGTSASSLCTPYGVTVDSSGNLYVADYGNSRVLEYNTPLTTDTTADRVFGQDDSFSSSDCNFGATSASAHSLCSPSGVAVDASGDLYVADTSNNRVLKYNPPFATNPIADVALGQANLTYNAANFPDAQKLDSPQGVAIDASTTPNRLYVADVQNSRVLGWKDVTAFTNGASADLVIGQPDPYSTACNSDTGGGNPTDDDLCNPYGVAVDAAGNLYVADANNNRVLKYTTPFAGCGSFPCV
ncbi:NHL repeat-containing protein, partial [Candidatus Binatus sp.]|uniref:NHL repeat-containing protein n=1 Tax=Candidatus Binatus sp. TaxID=2811406 RepID=UPI003C3CF5C2